MTSYLLLTLIPLLAIIMFDLKMGGQFLLRKKFYLLLVVVTGMMLIFDTLLTSLPIVMYNPTQILGIRVGSIPIEDFLYGYAFVIFLLNAAVFKKILGRHYKSILKSSRPFSWVNTAFPAAVGILITRGYFRYEDIALIGFFLLPYNLILYGVNDIYDYATDKFNPRKNSIEGGLLSPDLHPLMWWSVGLAILCSILIIVGQSAYFILLFIATLLIAIFYSALPLRTKQIPILDSVTSSLHFVLPAVVGIAWVGGIVMPLIGLISFFFWGIASHMVGALPDIDADTKAGERTVATFFGKNVTAILAVVSYIICIGLLFFISLPLWIILPLCVYPINAAWSLRDHVSLLRKRFRFFMMYNLLYGFLITIYLIDHYLF